MLFKFNPILHALTLILISSRHLGGVCLEAGAETTSALVLSVLLCLVAFPEEQRKCHEEIDRVIGSARSPAVTDYANLPYIQAFVREVSSGCSG